MRVIEFIYENKSAPATSYEVEILKTKIVYCRRTIKNYTVELENEFKETEKIKLAILKVG